MKRFCTAVLSVLLSAHAGAQEGAGVPGQLMPSGPQQATLPQAGQWVSSGTQAPGQPQAQVAAGAQQQLQAAFPQSAYGAQNYPVAAAGQVPGYTPPSSFPAAPSAAPSADDGTRGLFPPKKMTALEVVQEQKFPLTPDEIRSARVMYEEGREAKAYQPLRGLPRISSVSVDLAPGASMPVARILPGTPGTILFIDSTGAPWPIMAPPIISNESLFKSEWLKDTHVLVISSLSPYEVGTVTVFLKGLPTPVVVQLVAGEEGTQDSVRVTDVRLDVRVPGRGPNAKAPVFGPGKIELHDDTIQAVLDGVGVAGAKTLKLIGSVPAGTEVYQLDQQLYVRTTYDIKSPFDQTVSSANGTRVYRMPLTPYVTFSDMGRSVTVQIELL